MRRANNVNDTIRHKQYKKVLYVIICFYCVDESSINDILYA
jgi:hypothetical protein